jgi:uncharacterized protein HemY
LEATQRGAALCPRCVIALQSTSDPNRERETKVVQLLAWLGDACLRKEQYADAEHALNRAVQLEPNSTAPYIMSLLQNSIDTSL